MKRGDRYLYQNPQWPKFYWNNEAILAILADLKLAQGLLLGKMASLGFNLQEEAILTVLTEDVLKSSEIEGKILDQAQVRSSIARHLNINIGGAIRVDRDVDGVVEMLLDATQNYQKPLTEERLLGWQAALFPAGYSGIHKIITGKYRDDSRGAMQVVSGVLAKEKIHFEAPSAKQLAMEMTRFLEWFNAPTELDLIIKAGVAHLWFITLHPFEDGNGRIARALTDHLLAKSENTKQRFYSMSAQIRKERKGYYDILERSQKGNLDITNWLIWFLNCLDRAIASSEQILAKVISKALFWQEVSVQDLNSRQSKVINKLLDGFEGHLTSSKWAKLCHCSQDTAGRDIEYLLAKLILKKVGQGRSTSYELNDLNGQKVEY